MPTTRSSARIRPGKKSSRPQRNRSWCKNFISFRRADDAAPVRSERLGCPPPKLNRSCISHCMKRWHFYNKLKVGVALTAFETTAEPPECSVVEIEPALAERSRIDPFQA